MPRFAEIHGQTQAHDLLRRIAARGRTPHAYLFEGAPGVGKTTTAFALGQYLNCEAPTPEDSCGVCRSCTWFMKMHHPDLHWVFPIPAKDGKVEMKGERRAKHIQETREARASLAADGKAGPRPIEAWRFTDAVTISIGRDSDHYMGSIRELRDEAGKHATEARTKIFVISEADRMKAEAANSLLKILEEPPRNNLLVLTTANPGALLTTILSRCQSVRFRDLGEEEIAARLREREGTDPAKAALAAALARGSLTRAARLAEEDVIEDRTRALALLELVPGDPRVHLLVQDLGRKRDRSELERMFDFALVWLSDVLKITVGAGERLSNADLADRVRAHAGRYGVEGIRARKTAFETAKRSMLANVNLEVLLHRLVVDLNREATPERAAAR